MRFGNSGELTHRYVYGPRDQVLADETFKTVGTQRVSDEVLWQLADQQGTVRDVVNTQGVFRKHVDYDSFGKIDLNVNYDRNGTPTISPPGVIHPDTVDQLFFYTGQERDAATGMQKHGARWYSPSIGRWMSEDPSGFDGGDPNLYRYVGNGPHNGIDPTGLIQAGNPLANLNLFAGGYTGGTVSAFKPVNQFVSSTSIFASPTSIPSFNTNLGLPNYNSAQPNLAGGISSYLATPAPSAASVSVLGSGIGSLTNPSSLSVATTRLPSVKISTAALPSDSQIFSNYFNDPNYGSISRRADEIASHKLAQHLIQQGSPTQAFAGRLALSLEQAGHGLYPGVGEYQDAEGLFSRDSSLTQRAISGLSLGINIATAGTAPNFGGVSRTATNSLDDVVRAQRLTHQIDALADSRFYTQIDTFSLPAGVRSSGPQSIAEAVQNGRIGETAAGISAAKKGYVSPLSGKTRFPDEVLDAVREVKNVKYQGLTSQIKDYIAIAQNLGKKFELTVRESTILSRPLQEAREAMDVIVTYLKGL